MFYVMNKENLVLFDDNLIQLETTRGFMPQLTEETRETDIVTAEELRQYPNKVVAVPNEYEVEVQDYETIYEEGQIPIYDENGEITGYETITVEKQVPAGTHTEIRVYYTLALNPDFATEEAMKEAERIAMLYLTAADVERGIYKAKGLDFEDIINVLTANPQEGLDIKALKIELKANHFYRANPYVSAVGALLGFTEKQLDKFFEDGNYEHLLEVTDVE